MQAGSQAVVYPEKAIKYNVAGSRIHKRCIQHLKKYPSFLEQDVYYVYFDQYNWHKCC